MSAPEILEKLTRYVAEELLEGNDVGLEPTTPLLELGVLNSMEIVRLMTFIEKSFAVKVPEELITAANLADLDAIARLVLSRRSVSP